MIIQSSNVFMASRRSYERTKAGSASLTQWGGGLLQSKNIQMINRYSEKSDTGKNNQQNAKNSENGLFHEFRQAQPCLNQPDEQSRHPFHKGAVHQLFDADAVWQGQPAQSVYQRHHRTAYVRRLLWRDLLGVSLRI